LEAALGRQHQAMGDVPHDRRMGGSSARAVVTGRPSLFDKAKRDGRYALSRADHAGYL